MLWPTAVPGTGLYEVQHGPTSKTGPAEKNLGPLLGGGAEENWIETKMCVFAASSAP